MNAAHHVQVFIHSVYLKAAGYTDEYTVASQLLITDLPLEITYVYLVVYYVVCDSDVCTVRWYLVKDSFLYTF